MDYQELASELLNSMYSLRRTGFEKGIAEFLHGEAAALHHIAFCSGEALPSGIRRKLGVSSARTAQVLNNAESKGWITRQIDQRDRRRVLIELTPKGRAIAEKHRREVVGLAAKMLSVLEEHDAREYVRITGKLAEITAGTTAGLP
ncbi:MAG: MarR family winged helix-turn-helix transcriptional regulator [Coriobacteriia bacterium]|nr:MarR family winged helix-turn-helix transcriptional regulator [Coriobacteriia bacterium]